MGDVFIAYPFDMELRALSCSTPQSLGKGDRQTLLQVATNAITHVLVHHASVNIDPRCYSKLLQEERATFVTLEISEQLRGCIGTLNARQALVLDVAANACAAAFNDHRFPRLGRSELGQVVIHISVLGPSEPVQFETQQELLEKIRPGVDGLILSEGSRRGTFLPSVWDQVSSPVEFVHHLKIKAGLPADYWSDSIRVERYTTESFS